MGKNTKELTELKHTELAVTASQIYGKVHPLVWFLFCEEEDSNAALKILYKALEVDIETHPLFSEKFISLHNRALQRLLGNV